MTAEFVVHTQPKGKGRPRFARVGNSVRTYTPAKTADYEEMIRQAYFNQCRGTYFGKSPVFIFVDAYFQIPKSRTKADKELMRAGKIRPTVKADADNILKSIMDALNGIAYEDDAQIVFATVRKFYAENPEIRVQMGVYPVHEK